MLEDLSVIIVDDYELSRMGLRYMLSNMPKIKTVEEVENSKELFELLKKFEPDIIFMDLYLEEEMGIEVTQKVLSKYPDIYVIALTTSSDARNFTEMIEAGASGFLLKNIKKEELKTALDEILKGNMYFSKEFLTLAKKLVPKKEKKHAVKLSDREREVLNLICKGHSNQEIADEIKVSIHTVDAHRRSLLSKTEAKNTANLIMISFRDGLIEY